MSSLNSRKTAQAPLRFQSLHHLPRNLAMSRRAVTAIELLIVLAIITILVSLTVPAVNRAREAALRRECQNNLRQLSLALTQFHSIYGHYPTNGGYAPGSTIKSSQGRDVEISTLDYSDGITRKWGIGNPHLKPNDQTGSWAYAILNNIEQTSAFINVKVQNIQPLFLCPSRARRPSAIPINDEYGEYVSGGWAWAKTDYCASAKACPNLPANPTIELNYKEFLLGEKAFDPRVQRPNSWYWDEPIFSGGSWGTIRSGDDILDDHVGIDFKNNWGSAHLGGANFAFSDGRVETFFEKIGRRVQH